MRDPFYAKAPLVLVRFPVLLVGMFLGATLLSFVVALFPLGIEAAGNRFLRGHVDEGTVTRYGMGVTYENENVRFAMTAPDGTDRVLYERMEEVFETEIRELPVLGDVLGSIRGPQVEVVAGKDDMRVGRLFYRETAVEHVRIIDGEAGSGVMIADTVAEPLNIHPGDEVNLVTEGRRVSVRVAAVYAALHLEPLTGFWRPWRSSIYPACPGDPGTSGCTPPPPFVLVSKSQVVELATALGRKGAAFGWDAPLERVSDLTLDDARALEAAYRDLASRMSRPDDPLNELFRCCGPQYVREARYLTETRFSSSVSEVLTQTERRLAAVRAPVRLLQLISMVIAGAAVLAAAAYSFRTRRTEMSFLHARGFNPFEIWSRSALESGPVAAVAALFGLGIAVLVVRVAAGDTPIGADAYLAALLLVSMLFPLIIIGLATGTAFLFNRFRVIPDEDRRGGTLRAIFELSVLALATWIVIRSLVSADATTSVGWLHIATPIALLATTALLAARGLEAALGWFRPRSSRFPHAAYLAVHRAAGARVGILLFALALTFFGLFQHGLSVGATLDETIVAKSRLFVGSDVAATVDVGDVPPADLPWPATTAWRIPHVDMVDVDSEVDVIAVDPATLGEVAYWDPRFGAPSIADLMRRLSAASGSLPAIYVGAEQPRELDLGANGAHLSITPIARVSAFPGLLSRRPTVVVTQEDLRAVIEDQGSGLLATSGVAGEWWLRGDPDEIASTLPTVDDPPYSITTAEEVRDIPYISTTRATFRILDVLGIVGALLILVSGLAYLQSAERSRAVSAQLSARMGLPRRGHVAAAAIELFVFIVIAYIVAVVPATIASTLIVDELDPLGSIPPDVLFSIPLAWVIGGGFAAAVAAICGSILVSRRALRSNVSDLMRVAD